ncbi:hypothetical protein CU097_005609 [Rhizopus azygosporus]|uniref:FAS1 domain-containing protein n=2 Tax=Rhizopus TaxID=4842 RepID=A0A367JBL8_RHIAZ|nr:FAS1 domain-containing protein [Rhizopus microsporus]RCH87330.1 hypothetical protein CU097_005609 [Rhizopus azygosporus]
MKAIQYLAIALFAALAVFAQNETTPNATIFELLSTNNRTLHTARFINLLNSDDGYRPVIDLLSNSTANLTVFVPNDNTLNMVSRAYRSYNRAHNISSTSEYPPANWSYHNVTVLDVLQYHIVNESFLLTNLTTGNVTVAFSMLSNSSINHYINSTLPLLIQPNATYENATNQTWLDTNAQYLRFRVGNGVNSSTVINKDLNATNGHVNIIQSVLIPPLEPSVVIPKVRNVSYLAEALHRYPMLNETLNNATNFTIFAPDSKSFQLSQAEGMNNDTLRQLALSHIVYGLYFTTNFTQNATINNGEFNLTTFNNNATLPASVNATSSQITLNGTAKVIRSNILFNNGIMHIIDRPLNITNATA